MLATLSTQARAASRRTRMIGHWPGLGGLLIALLLFLLNVAIHPSFFSVGSLDGFASVYVPIACAAIGVSFAMLAGGIDLSIGGVVSLVNVVIIGFIGAGVHMFTVGPANELYICANPGACTGGWPFWAAAIAGVAAGTLVGALNGFAIGILRIHPLLATLATGFVASGLALYFMPAPGGSVPRHIVQWYGDDFAGVPMPFWLLVIVGVAGLLILRSRVGLRQRAIGTDPWKAFVSGVVVGRSRFGAYVLSSFFVSVGAMLLTMNIASGDPNSGSSFTLDAIAAAVLGGVSLAGGWSDPIGPIFGTFLLGLVSNLVLSTAVPSFYEILVTGAVIILGLAATQLIRQRGLRSAVHSEVETS